jgi:uncharacterized membrane protein YbaN (DUF454 family)
VGLGFSRYFVARYADHGLLLAGACFVRSSDRLHRWPQNHRILGLLLREGKGRLEMPRRAKMTTLSFLWMSILCSAFILVALPWLRLALLAIAVGGPIIIIRSENDKACRRIL